MVQNENENEKFNIYLCRSISKAYCLHTYINIWHTSVYPTIQHIVKVKRKCASLTSFSKEKIVYLRFTVESNLYCSSIMQILCTSYKNKHKTERRKKKSFQQPHFLVFQFSLSHRCRFFFFLSIFLKGFFSILFKINGVHLSGWRKISTTRAEREPHRCTSKGWTRWKWGSPN